MINAQALVDQALVYAHRLQSPSAHLAYEGDRATVLKFCDDVLSYLNQPEMQQMYRCDLQMKQTTAQRSRVNVHITPSHPRLAAV